ncbi:MAG: hypothetical protein AABX52_00050 [Nanoarchaeota archaeon]
MTTTKTLLALGLASILQTTPYTPSYLQAQTYQTTHTQEQLYNKDLYDKNFKNLIIGLRSNEEYARWNAVRKADPIFKKYDALGNIANIIANTEKPELREKLIEKLQKQYTIFDRKYVIPKEKTKKEKSKEGEGITALFILFGHLTNPDLKDKKGEITAFDALFYRSDKRDRKHNKDNK